jgi:S-DNA-T family DNA segregation ATPase FtsK/SpoIIIE
MGGAFKKFRRDISGIIWIAAGTLLGLALASFRPSDPSFNSTGLNLQVHNFCGYVGSFTADMIYQLLGVGAWVLVFASCRFGIQTLRGKAAQLMGPHTLWAALLLVTVTSLLSLYFPATRLFAGTIPIGGFTGAVVSRGLISALSFFGVSVVLWSLALVLVVFYTERSVQDLVQGPLQGGIAVARRFFAAAKNINQGNGIKPEPVKAVSQPAADKKKPEAKRAAASRFNFLLGGKKGVLTSEATAQAVGQDSSTYDAANNVAKEAEPLEAAEFDGEGGVDADSAEAPKRGLFSALGAAARGASKIEADVPRRKVKLTAKIERRIENWKLPDISLLEDPPATRIRVDEREMNRKGQILVDKLAQFSVNGEIAHAKPGPAVTMYEFKPNADVKISKITELADDLSLALSSESVRIIAPIPGRDVVGIETSNAQREIVYLKDILANDTFWNESMRLPICLGRQADGESKVVDLRKMPHLMVAGTTGSGKSVFVVSAITGLLFRHSPKSLRLILIDPKQVDLAAFSNIPHLLMPPIREPKKAVSALKWAIREMDKRYRSMSRFGARGLEGFNDIVNKMSKEDFEKHEQTNAEWEQDARKLEQYYYTQQPYIVIVVEEFGDLMAVDKANVESLVVRLAQMARACGIHLVLAMQSPRKDVVTGLIKTNIPGRISFKVASKMDSRIILDDSGGERLLPNGDCLYLAPGVSKPQRHHAPWVTEAEINAVMKSWSEQGEPQYDVLAMRALEGSGGGFDLAGESEGAGDGFGDGDENEYDERYDEILSHISSLKEVSASLLQRKFKLGYPRAARMIEIFEREGVVGPANGSKPRPVLVNSFQVK